VQGAKIVDLKFKKRLIKQDEIGTAVYFPLTGGNIKRSCCRIGG